MTATKTLGANTRESYDLLAPAYDLFTGLYAYEQWLGSLEELACSHGLGGRRLLDVACGTGKSFLPLLARGYQVTGCDISEGMLSIARRKAPEVPLHQADMRELPVFGRFDLITCLDDALNYLLDERDLVGALAGIARNLADGGIAVWDLNTIAQYRGQFAHDQIVAHEDMFIGWRGEPRATEAMPGDTVEIVLDIFAHAGRSQWRRSSSLHRQRHWPRATIELLSRHAGLQLVDVRGQRPGAVIDDHLDELVHTKAIYVARPRREARP